MQLAGVIDAAVQGGVEKYREAFFDGTYLMVHPQHAPFIQQFKAALGTQLEVLKEGLDVFGSKMDKSLIPLHTHLSKTYAVMSEGLAEMATTSTAKQSL
jgi:recombinational DNA repair ATPase RecF